MRRRKKRIQLPPHLRGYGPEHRKLRRTLDARVQAGGVNCSRCGKPIIPGTPWHLDHSDTDRTKYRGASHAYCNTTAPNRNRRRRSRDW